MLLVYTFPVDNSGSYLLDIGHVIMIWTSMKLAYKVIIISMISCLSLILH